MTQPFSCYDNARPKLRFPYVMLTNTWPFLHKFGRGWSKKDWTAAINDTMHGNDIQYKEEILTSHACVLGGIGFSSQQYVPMLMHGAY
jgi:hypothetical protein